LNGNGMETKRRKTIMKEIEFWTRWRYEKYGFLEYVARNKGGFYCTFYLQDDEPVRIWVEDLNAGLKEILKYLDRAIKVKIEGGAHEG